MGERGLDVLDKYDIEVLRTVKVRGAIKCELDKGAYLLKEYGGTLPRIEFEDKILNALAERIYVETYIRNVDGELVTESEEGVKYVIKTWHEGRECNVREPKEVCLAVRMLAWLHIELAKLDDIKVIVTDNGNIEGNIKSVTTDAENIEGDIKHTATGAENNEGDIKCAVVSDSNVGEDIKDKFPGAENTKSNTVTTSFEPHREPMSGLFLRHNRELKRVKTYIKARKTKSSIERLIINSFDMFYEQAVQAFSMSEEVSVDIPKAWTHGEFSHHNVILGPRVNVITEFSHLAKGIQIEDLYYFTRKILEKNKWDIRLANSMFDAYNSVRKVSEREWDYLYLLYLYPEKYWKQLNFYYNSNKVWIPEKNINKLQSIIGQKPTRDKFLENLFERTTFAAKSAIE